MSTMSSSTSWAMSLSPVAMMLFMPAARAFSAIVAITSSAFDAGHRNDGPAEGVLQNAVKAVRSHLVAEVLPLRVEDDDGVIGLGKRPDLAEHAQKAPDGPRRLARTRAKVGKAVKGAEKIVGAVDEKNLGHVGSRCCKCMNGP